MPSDDLTEWIAPDLKGFEGHGPVRIGNAAVEQTQHDAYGSVILAATPMFFDKRLPGPGNESLFQLLEKMARQCAALALEPDAGIWEFRGRKRIHTHSGAMCWAGLSRTAAIAARLGLSDRARYWQRLADDTGEALLSRVWNEKRKAFAAAEGTDDMDASVLLLPELGLIDAPIRALPPQWPPSNRTWCAAAMSCAMPPRMISACRRPNFWSAASG